MLLAHGNGALRHVTRLDFTVAGREGKDRGYYGGGGSNRRGVRSHGAHALSEVLAVSRHVAEVRLDRNRIGPYGAAAVFAAVGENPHGRLRTLRMRGCRIGERGARAFVEEVRRAGARGGGGGFALREVDLSANRIGCGGCYAIEDALKERAAAAAGDDSGGGKDAVALRVDLEGNMVYQEVSCDSAQCTVGESQYMGGGPMWICLNIRFFASQVMNCVTHGLGVLLGTLGTKLLSRQVIDLPHHYGFSCRIYCLSLMVLYTSSTLYHSFFALKKTKFIFKVFDRCAIYLLIAGSYTPFFMIGLQHEPKWQKLLLFIWVCAISGVLVSVWARSSVMWMTFSDTLAIFARWK